jgi:hypothetical protein
MDPNHIMHQLGQQLGITPVERLVERYQDVCHKYISRQWEDCLAYTGKFIESVIRCLLYYVHGEVYETIDVGIEIRNLSNLTKDTYDSSTRIHIPRVCRALYDLRSNWGGGHDSLEVNPMPMDAQFAFIGVKWLMLELLRRFSSLDSSDIQMLINTFQPPSVLMQRIDDDLVLFDNSMTIRNAVIIAAAHWFPERVESNKFIQSISWRNARSIRTELSMMVRLGYLHKNSEGYLATQKTLSEELDVLKRYYQKFQGVN